MPVRRALAVGLLSLACAPGPAPIPIADRTDAAPVDAAALDAAPADAAVLDAAPADAAPLDAAPLDAATPDVESAPDAERPDATAAGGFGDPIEIASLPFVDRRDTRLAPSDLADVYVCAGDEGGPTGRAYLYRLTLERPGVLLAALSELGPGVDVDLYHLTAAAPESCTLRDAEGLSLPVPAGVHYLAVETVVDPTGPDRAGAYRLDVSLQPEPEPTGPLGTFDNPIAIDAFPFVDRRDTSAAPADRLDAYACAPGTDEGGGELIYVFTIPAPGRVSLAVDDVPGDAVDVDVHLLTAPDPASCLARDDVAIARDLAAGTYFVVVDTYVDRAGAAKPGPYTLTVDFTPAGPVGPGVGTPADPIVVDRFPFRDARTTEVATSDAFDRYACAPATDESGPEYVYRLDLPERGVLQVSVDDRAGDAIDVDVHLLDRPDPAACLARHNRSLSLEVEPGTRWLTVDTWVSSAGRALAGAYALSVDLVPSPDLAAYCLILFGDTRGGSASDPQAAHRAVVTAIGARCAPDALVHSGDMVRSSSSDGDWSAFRAIETDLLSAAPFYPARGNHDGSWTNVKNRIGALVPTLPPSSRYQVELSPGLTLIGLDSEQAPDDQVAFLTAALDAHPDPAHRFVVTFHRPLYPSLGGHAGFTAGVTHWAPVFRRHAGRVLVLTGHNHGLSREVVDGVTYLTSGGGGAPLYGCGQAHAGTRYCGDQHGYTVCDDRLRCRVYEVDPVTGREELADAFSLAP